MSDKSRWIELTKSLAIIIPIAVSSTLSIVTYFKGEPGAKRAYEVLSERTNDLLENQKKFEENQHELEMKLLKVKYFQLGLFEGREQSLITKPKAMTKLKPKPERLEKPERPERLFKKSKAPAMKRLPDELETVQQQEAF